MNKINIIQKEKENTKKNSRIFLSYTRADKEYADKLHRILSRRFNFRVFTTEALSAGENWKSKLKTEISSCDIFVVLLSSNSVHSGWVLSELGAAWAINKVIIPVIINSESEVISKIPIDLRELQAVEFKAFEAHPESMDQIFKPQFESGLAAAEI